MEVTKWLKPSMSVSRIGDSASVQAATRVNAEQASTRTMCRPTRRPFRGRLIWLGEPSEEYTQLLHRGSGNAAAWRQHHCGQQNRRIQRAHDTAAPQPVSAYERTTGLHPERSIPGCFLWQSSTEIRHWSTPAGDEPDIQQAGRRRHAFRGRVDRDGGK